ncbi:MAG: NACHT domain-containing protein [Oculatellaceae cyanobacterium bins.114]|nr:NACHT domain-containing protein [Oculatellaceae cyanobacterium bins.114]
MKYQRAMLSGADVVKTLALSIFQMLFESSSRVLYQLNESLQQEVFKASNKYNQNYSERHGTLKVLGMREPIPLESVYIAVQFLDNNTIRRFETIEALENVYRQAQQRSLYNGVGKRKSGLEVANQTQYMMVLGGPGMGKSTFLRKVGLEILTHNQPPCFQHDCIPVLIELKEFRLSDINIEGAIANEFETCGFPYHQKFTRAALEQGKLLILLDGLDEVPAERMSEAIAKIRNFVDRYDKNRFIISCRIAAYRHNFRRFTDVEIANFDDQQIYQFIQHWFAHDAYKGQECWTKLVSSDYAAAKELTHTPLLLTLTCLLYQRAGQFPTNRATLYEKALRTLLEEWSGEKGLPQASLYRGLDTKRKELMISKIAYDAFQNNRFFLSRRELASQIEHLLKEMLPDEPFIDGYAVLKSIEVHHGILVERAEGIYSFSHLTLQEFLTAQHIIDTRQDVQEVVVQHLVDHHWREVFLLLAGLQQADELLVMMEKQATSLIQTPNLRNLLTWADQITTGSEGSYKPVVKRAIAMFLALDLAQALALDQARVRALNLDIDRARNLALALDHTLTLNRALDLALVRALDLSRALDLVIDIAHKFEEIKIFHLVKFNVLIAWLDALKVKAPHYQKTLASRKAFIEQVHQTWLNALNLHREWINLSRSEVTALDQYLFANLLIVQCRRSAVWVSPQTWETIEDKIMRVSATYTNL